MEINLSWKTPRAANCYSCISFTEHRIDHLKDRHICKKTSVIDSKEDLLACHALVCEIRVPWVRWPLVYTQWAEWWWQNLSFSPVSLLDVTCLLKISLGNTTIQTKSSLSNTKAEKVMFEHVTLSIEMDSVPASSKGDLKSSSGLEREELITPILLSSSKTISHLLQLFICLSDVSYTILINKRTYMQLNLKVRKLINWSSKASSFEKEKTIFKGSSQHPHKFGLSKVCLSDHWRTLMCLMFF